jgi:protoheme IX farnesyltransferase
MSGHDMSSPGMSRAVSFSRAADFLALTKPRITFFILMSTAVGFLCGAHLGHPWTWRTLLHTLLGTGLIASGTAALNPW